MSAQSTARSTGPGAAMVLSACLSIQVGAAAAAQLFDDLGSWGASALRLLLAAGLMLLAARPRIRAWDRLQWRSVIALGLALAGMNGFIYAAIQRIPLGTAVAIEFLGPLVLAACLSRRSRDLLWVALAFIGMALLGVESAVTAASLDPLGVVFGLLAGAFWALYILASAETGKQVPGLGGLSATMIIAAVVVVPIGASGAVRVVEEPGLLLFALAAALLSSVLPYSLEIAALRRLPSDVFSVLLSLEPAIAAVVGWVLLGQGAGVLSIAGVSLVVLASMGVTLGQGRTRADPEPSAA